MSSVFSIRNLITSTSVYAWGNLVTRAVPFLLLPVLTRFLSPEDYGILATFMAIFGIVQVVIYMGTTDAIVRQYFDREKEGFDFAHYLFNGIFINFIVFTVIVMLWLLLKPYLQKIIPIPFVYQLLIPVLGLFVSINGIRSKLWVIMKKPVAYTAYNFSNTLLDLSASLFLVVALGLDWRGRVLGFSLAYFLFFLLSLYLLTKDHLLRISFNRTYLRGIVRYGFPIVLHSLGFVIIAAVDRFFLNKYTDLSTTGVYSVSYSLCSIIIFLTGAFNMAWVPVLYEKLGEASEPLLKKIVSSVYIYYGAIIAGVALFIITAPYVLRFIVGEKFQGAGVFIFWLALGMGFHSMYVAVVNFIFYSKKTHVLSMIAVFTIIMSVVSNYVLIKINGAIGVAQATCLVYLSRFLLVWYSSNRIFPMPWFSFAAVNKVRV